MRKVPKRVTKEERDSNVSSSFLHGVSFFFFFFFFLQRDRDRERGVCLNVRKRKWGWEKKTCWRKDPRRQREWNANNQIKRNPRFHSLLSYFSLNIKRQRHLASLHTPFSFALLTFLCFLLLLFHQPNISHPLLLFFPLFSY